MVAQRTNKNYLDEIANQELNNDDIFAELSLTDNDRENIKREREKVTDKALLLNQSRFFSSSSFPRFIFLTSLFFPFVFSVFISSLFPFSYATSFKISCVFMFLAFVLFYVLYKKENSNINNKIDMEFKLLSDFIKNTLDEARKRPPKDNINEKFLSKNKK